LPFLQTNSATQANVGRRLRADSGLDLSQLNANVANQANVAAVNSIGKDNTGIVAQVGGQGFILPRPNFYHILPICLACQFALPRATARNPCLLDRAKSGPI
jgi:hypothetical protein